VSISKPLHADRSALRQLTLLMSVILALPNRVVAGGHAASEQTVVTSSRAIPV
jgi:hypothetical protein